MANQPTFTLLHGEDDLRIEEALHALRDAMRQQPNGDLNMDDFDGETADVAAIVNAAMAFPFLSDMRMVVAKGLLAYITRKDAGERGKKAVELLKAQLPQLPPSARLVFVESAKLPDTHPIVKLARDHANGEERAFGVPPDVTKWIIDRAAKRYQAVIEPRAAAALSEIVVVEDEGNVGRNKGQIDLRRTDNELIKLASYVNGERPISEADVELLTPYMRTVTVYAFTDAMIEGRARDALHVLNTLYEHKKQDRKNSAFEFYVSTIIPALRSLLLVKEYLSSGGSPHKDAIAKAIGIAPFMADKLARQSRRFTLAQWEAIYRRAQQYDREMKTGGITADIAVDLLVATLARE